jgi:hypothetical protein
MRLLAQEWLDIQSCQCSKGSSHDSHASAGEAIALGSVINLHQPCWLEQRPAKVVPSKDPTSAKEANMLGTTNFRADHLYETREENGILAATKAVVLGGLMAASFWLFTSFLFLS